jgi:hypothetical protein
MGAETVWVAVEVLAMTSKAVYVTDGKEEVWLPLSAVVDSEDDLRIGLHTKIELSASFAETKGLV